MARKIKRNYIHYVVTIKGFFSTKKKVFLSKLQAEKYADYKRKELFGWIKEVTIRKK